MPYDEYDGEVWGLTKREIRQFIKDRGTGTFEDNFSAIIKPNRVGFYRGKGALSDRAHRTVRRQVANQMRERMGAFGHREFRARMEEKGGMMPVDSFYAWAYSKMGVTETETENKREQSFFELKHLNVAMGKKKVVADIISCFTLVNDHTLYRLVQRGATNDKPLEFLTRGFDQWKTYAAVFMLSHRFIGEDLGTNVLIPFANGALLAKMTFMEKDTTPFGWSRHRLRLIDTINNGKLESAPYEAVLDNEFQGKEGSVTLQVATWIPQAYFHTEQWWAVQQIEKFVNEYKNVVDYCVDVVHGYPDIPALDHREVDEKRILQFGEDLGRIFSNRRWAIACQW